MFHFDSQTTTTTATQNKMKRKSCCVIELGKAWVKCGVSGEASPRVMFRSSGDIRRDIKQALQHSPMLFISRPTTNTTSSGGMDEDDESFESEGNEGVEVVVVEGFSSTSRSQRDVVSEFMIKVMDVSRVAFLPVEVCAAMTLRANATCLVVDIGWSHCDVVPVIEGNVFVHGIQSSSRAGVSHAVDLLLMKERDSSSLSNQMKDTACRYLLHSSVEQQIIVPDITIDRNNAFVLDGNVRGHGAIDSLIRGEGENDEDNDGIVSLIQRSIHRCPVDCRKSLVSHILGIGGGWMIPGFSFSFFLSVHQLSSSSSSGSSGGGNGGGVFASAGLVKDVPFAANQCGWCGASALCCVSSKRGGIIPETSWAKMVDGKVITPTDWTDISLHH